jgi:L-threonine kinase
MPSLLTQSGSATAGRRTVRPGIHAPGINHAIIGYGKSFASFGEIVQGRLPGGDDFLVTLPVDLWSTCVLTCTPIHGPLVVECALEKSQAVVYQILEELGIDKGYHISVQFSRNIPVGKGLSSSTADMLATLRALQEVFGFLYRETFLSKVFINIEPHDAIFYNSSVAYNHRKGELIKDFAYIPDFHIVAVDRGGIVDTVSYNKKVEFTQERRAFFGDLLNCLNENFAAHNDTAIAECATASATMHAEATDSTFLRNILDAREAYGALGVLATHSGTCGAYLFPGTLDIEKIEDVMDRARQDFRLDVFNTQTLCLLK